MENEDEIINISCQDDYNYLIGRINNGPLFSRMFNFDSEDFFRKLLNSLSINYNDYIEKYFYYDLNRKIHISSSESGYVWISTYGLVAKGKLTNNNFLNACYSQFTVVSMLIEKAIEISKDEKVFDVDGYLFGQLSELTPAIFHNVLFYTEVFGKAYLSLCGKPVPHTHKLIDIYSTIDEVIYELDHNNSIFQASILDSFKKIIEYIETIPGGFKEQYVKYDDNNQDWTIILFDPIELNRIKETVFMSNDFISGLYYEGDEVHYLKNGLLEKLIMKAETEDEKKKVMDMFSYMVKETER